MITLAEAIGALSAVPVGPPAFRLAAALRTRLGPELHAAFDAHIGLLTANATLAAEARSTRSMYQTLVEQLPAVTYYRRLDTPGSASFLSPQVQALTGYPAEAFVADAGLWGRCVHPEDLPRVRSEQARFRPEEQLRPVRSEYRLVRADGQVIWVENYALAVRDEHGRATFLMGILFDVTERRRLEEKLRQAHKLEAIGKLAGGVAHDFNNLLSVILNYSDGLLEGLAAEDPRRADLAEIVRASERARLLTRELLAVGRRQMLAPRVFDLAGLVRDLEATLRRILGAEREVVVTTASTPAEVRADPAQITQVLLNLAANAADALPGAGRLAVAIDRAVIAAGDAEVSGAPTGDYIRLRMRDNGGGMDAQTAARAFEPFFTTKDKQQHAGLGLSTAFGIVRQSGGVILLESELARGTVVEVWLPAWVAAGPESAAPAAAMPSAPQPEENLTSAGAARAEVALTVLVTEDDTQVRRLVRRMLEHQGWRVLEAADGAEALAIVGRGEAFDVLLTDVMMPRMSGLQLAERLSELRPGTPVVFMSGHSEEIVQREGLPNHAPLLQKPFTAAELTGRLRAFARPAGA